MEKLEKMENILNKIKIKDQPFNIQKGLEEIISFTQDLKKYFNFDFSQQERIDGEKLIEKMERAVNKFDQVGSFQPIIDVLPMIRVKIKKYLKDPKMFFEAKKEKSIRLRRAERYIRSLVYDEESLKNLNVCLDSLMNMPSDYGPAIEGVFYGELKVEDNPNILGNQMKTLAPFYEALSTISPEEITEFLKKFKQYRSVADMVKHVIGEIKNGTDLNLTSKEKIIEYFFPEKKDVGTIQADLLAVIYEKKILDASMPKNLLLISNVVVDKFNSLATFLSVTLQTIMGKPEMKDLQKEIEKIGIAISTGTKMTMLTNRLRHESTIEEYIITLNEIERHLEELVGKINNDITPAFAKSKPGEWIMEYQKEVIEKGGINISELTRTKGFDTLKYINKKKEIIEEFEKDTTLDYLKLKAQEEETSISEDKIIQNAEKLLTEVNRDKGWTHEPTSNELPLYNASLGFILSVIKELGKEKDDLLKGLADITKKSITGAKLVPIVPGIKDENHTTASAVRKFISVLKVKTKELEEINRLVTTISSLSRKMVITNKKLPLLFIKDPKYLQKPLLFMEEIEKEKKRLIAQHESMAIEEEEFKKRTNAIDDIKRILTTLNAIYPQHRIKMTYYYWLADAIEEKKNSLIF